MRDSSRYPLDRTQLRSDRKRGAVAMDTGESPPTGLVLVEPWESTPGTRPQRLNVGKSSIRSVGYQDLIGNPLVVGAIATAATCFIIALVWIALSLRRASPELLQLMTFQRMGILQRATMAICASFIIEMILLVIVFADFVLPMAVLAAGAGVSGILFWYAIYLYARAFHVPRSPKHEEPQG
jgi:hypothetical protein